MSSRRKKPYAHRLKGVDALMGTPATVDTETDSYSGEGQSVTLEQIKLPASQPRRYFDPKKLEQLVESVREHGILEPLLVRPIADDSYELVAGERRYRAAKQAGLTEVPVVVRELTDTEALQLALIENLQREDLNPVEETEGILQLLALKLDTDQTGVISLLNQLANTKRELTDNVIRTEDQELIETVFAGIGRFSAESFRTNRLPLLNLPSEILDALREGRLAYTKAKVIAKVKDEEERKALLTEAIEQSLSIRGIRERVQGLKPQKPKDDFPSRWQQTGKRIKQTKVWDDPQKKEKLEQLLEQIEELLEEDTAELS